MKNNINDYILAKFIDTKEFIGLAECEQDLRHHPEGDAKMHSILAGRAMEAKTEDFILIFAAYAHDIGKLYAKKYDRYKQRNTYYEHDVEGEKVIGSFLEGNDINEKQALKIKTLVRYHMAPMHYKDAKPKAFKRLSKKLAEGGVTIEELMLVCLCDVEASDNNFEDLNEFENKYMEALIK